MARPADLGASPISGERSRSSGNFDATWRESRPHSRNRTGETAGGSSTPLAATRSLAGRRTARGAFALLIVRIKPAREARHHLPRNIRKAFATGVMMKLPDLNR